MLLGETVHKPRYDGFEQQQFTAHSLHGKKHLSADTGYLITKRKLEMENAHITKKKKLCFTAETNTFQ